MKVRELIELLSKGNPEAVVVRFGHFGEPLKYGKEDFNFHPDDSIHGFYFSIDSPDIGEELGV